MPNRQKPLLLKEACGLVRKLSTDKIKSIKHKEINTEILETDVLKSKMKQGWGLGGVEGREWRGRLEFATGSPESDIGVKI